MTTYHSRDVLQLAQVGNMSAFSDFLTYMAVRTGQELKLSEIAKNIGITVPTAKAWVTILERSGLLFILRAYHPKLNKRLVKTPKAYFLDTGLAAYLGRWPNAETLAHGPLDGAFLETYVISEIVKSYYNAGRRPELYYYRDVDQREIDLLIVEGQKLYPIEIKKAVQPQKAARHFGALEKLGKVEESRPEQPAAEHGMPEKAAATAGQGTADFRPNIQPGLIICFADDLKPYDRNNYFCPVWLL